MIRVIIIMMIAMCALPAKAQSLEELLCMVTNVYWEAEGEKIEGKVAVAAVILNRMKDDRFPTSACDVTTQIGAYQKPSEKRLNREPLYNEKAIAESFDAVIAAMAGAAEKTCPGITHFHMANMSNPPHWRHTKKRVCKIGNHIFYRWPQAVKRGQ